MNEKTLTDANFKSDVLEAKGVTLVDFWAPWCGPCKMLEPIVEQVAKEIGDKASIGKLNVDDNPQTAGAYGIMSIPTMLLFKDGEPVKSMVGVQSKEAILKAIEEVAN